MIILGGEMSTAERLIQLEEENRRLVASSGAPKGLKIAYAFNCVSCLCECVRERMLSQLNH